jgi:hypothetical protein
MCTTADVVKTDDGTNAGSVIGGVAPQFVSLLPDIEGDPNIVQEHVDCAIELNSRSYFGSKFCKAVAYHAAHTLALAYPALAQGSNASAGGASGGASSAAIQSLRAGDLAITYANDASAAQGGSGGESYSETRWGRMYLQLVLSCRKSPAIYFGC